MKPRLLDLFCCAGGASRGYADAGFEVVGVDINPQPRYPYEFHQADALTFPLDGFDAVHASPPCKRFTRLSALHARHRHPDLLTPTRERLLRSGLPWVIENVPGSPMRADLVLCGEMFGLGVRRHRWFETSPSLFSMLPPCRHDRRVVSVHGMPGGRSTRDGVLPTFADWKAAMGIDWMSVRELSQAIPPAYTRFIGEQLMAHLRVSS
ncbi:DNA cytosine methyltransferase [Micromonosporaceae bacterium B7E4]